MVHTWVHLDTAILPTGEKWEVFIMSNDLLKKELEEIEDMVKEAKEHEDYTEKVFIIREGMIKLAGGFVQAALLSSLLGWTRHWLKTDNEVYQQIQRAAENKDLQMVRKLKNQIRQGWFWKSFREMSAEMLGQVSLKTCQRYVEKFEDMGLIWSRDPEEKATYRAKWYKANIEKIKEELNKLGFELDHFKDLKNGTGQNDKSATKGNFDKIKYSTETDKPLKNSICQNDKHLLYTTITNQSFTNKQSKYVGNNPHPNFQEVVSQYAENYKLSKYAKKKLEELIVSHGELLVIESLSRAVQSETDKPIAYMGGVLRKWSAANVQTLEDIQRYEEAHRRSKEEKKKPVSKPKKVDKLPVAVQQQIEQTQKEVAVSEASKMSEEELKQKQAEIRAKLKTMNESLNSWMHKKQNKHS